MNEQTPQILINGDLTPLLNPSSKMVQEMSTSRGLTTRRNTNHFNEIKLRKISDVLQNKR